MIDDIRQKRRGTVIPISQATTPDTTCSQNDTKRAQSILSSHRNPAAQSMSRAQGYIRCNSWELAPSPTLVAQYVPCVGEKLSMFTYAVGIGHGTAW